MRQFLQRGAVCGRVGVFLGHRRVRGARKRDAADERARLKLRQGRYYEVRLQTDYLGICDVLCDCTALIGLCRDYLTPGKMYIASASGPRKVHFIQL
jgi:hypothetical protein